MTFLVMLWSIIMMSLCALYQTVWLQNSLQLIYTVSGGAQADHNLETSHTKLTANKRQMCHIQALCHLSFIMSRMSFLYILLNLRNTFMLPWENVYKAREVSFYKSFTSWMLNMYTIIIERKEYLQILKRSQHFRGKTCQTIFHFIFPSVAKLENVSKITWIYIQTV